VRIGSVLYGVSLAVYIYCLVLEVQRLAGASLGHFGGFLDAALDAGGRSCRRCRRRSGFWGRSQAGVATPAL
jgi:hypothetical protein